MPTLGIATGGTIQNQDPASLSRDLDLIQTTGAQWVRVDINWAQIQASGAGAYNWTAIDTVVTGAIKRGLKVLGVILYTPSWLGPALAGPPPSTYAMFCKAAVQHYAALGVHAYELWNEQNTAAFWTAPDPVHYTALLKNAYPAIKAADPTAKVIAGGLSPAPTDANNFSPVDFLTAIYAAGAAGSFDAIAHHPYCWPAMPGDAQGWSAWYQMYGAPTSLRTVMGAHGDSAKQIWATEFGAPSKGPGSVGLEAQGAMITKAASLWSTYTWAGPLFIYQHRDQGSDVSTRENFFGLVNVDGEPKLALAALQAAAG